MPLPFNIADLVDDNADGWGPTTVPEHLKDVPFAPFSKGDKLGKASDWTQQAYQKNYGRYGNQQQQPGAAVFNFFHNEEEDSFHLVDSRPAKPPKYGARRFQHQRQAAQRARDSRMDGGKEGERRKPAQQRKNPWQQAYQQGREQQRLVQYTASVEIRPEWAVVEQIPFPSLAKLSCSVGEPTDLLAVGELEYYDKAYDRITLRMEKPLERTRRVFRSVTTSDDPAIRKLAASGAARVFATDAILTALMCAKSSVYSWDVVATRAGDKLFFDKRDRGPLDFLTVNETAPEQVVEDKDAINGVQQLAVEATVINQNLSQQMLAKGGPRYPMGGPNPFAVEGEGELASVGYRYRKWTLNADAGVDIVVRCELDGAINVKGEDQLCSIKALNEFDSRATEWRKKVESQRGAMIGNEIKNNKNKLARWTAAALLAGADQIKLGYVSRASPRDNTTHVILGTQTCKPREFAAQIYLNMDNCWGIVRAVVDMLLKLDDGKYLLVKDPNKDLLRLYAVPDDAFDTHYVDEPLGQGDVTDEVTAVVVPAVSQLRQDDADD